VTWKTRTTMERAVIYQVMGVNCGWCVLGCGTPAADYAHRWAEGQGGPVTPSNGLALCGPGNAGGCHGLTHGNPTIAKACGWMLLPHTDPITVPALIVTPLAPDGDWHVLDDGSGLPRLAEPGEIPAGMWTGTLADASRAMRGAA
jgi:hypothetical protein